MHAFIRSFIHSFIYSFIHYSFIIHSFNNEQLKTIYYTANCVRHCTFAPDQSLLQDEQINQ